MPIRMLQPKSLRRPAGDSGQIECIDRAGSSDSLSRQDTASCAYRGRYFYPTIVQKYTVETEPRDVPPATRCHHNSRAQCASRCGCSDVGWWFECSGVLKSNRKQSRTAICERSGQPTRNFLLGA